MSYIILIFIAIFVIGPMTYKQYLWERNFRFATEYDEYKDDIFRELFITKKVTSEHRGTYSSGTYSSVSPHYAYDYPDRKKFGDFYSLTGTTRFESEREYRDAILQVMEYFQVIPWVKEDLRESKLDNILSD